MSYQQALDNFISSADFKVAVNSSTQASWNGDGYSLVLREDGTYTTWWNKDLRCAEGDLVIPVPPLGDEDWNEDPDLRWYINVEDQIVEDFQEKMESMIKA